MNEFVNKIVNVVKDGDAVAREAIKDNVPKLELSEIIKLISRVYGAEDKIAEATTVAKELADIYKEPFKEYVNVFCVDVTETMLSQIDKGNEKRIANTEFAQNIVNSAKDIEKVVRQYLNGELRPEQLINALCDTGIVKIVEEMISSAGVDWNTVKEGVSNVSKDIPRLAVAMMSVCAFAEAYKILKSALDDATITREQRILVEKQCTESIEMMRQYRLQMNEIASNYLFEHADAFNKGIAAMDRAILEGDINGFIKGNTDIQDILNYEVQFRNEEEFDSLMDSDIAFKL